VKCEQLLSENRLLLEEREANQQETYEVTEFLRKEILRKNEKIASLEAILEQREILVEQEKAAFIKHAEHKVNGASWARFSHNSRLTWDPSSVSCGSTSESIEWSWRSSGFGRDGGTDASGGGVGLRRRAQSSSSSGAHARVSWWRRWST
jgi:hypothetical protein